MRLEKVSLIIVGVVVVIALAVPFWRGLAGSQLRQTMPWSATNAWSGDINPSIPGPHPKTDSQLLKERPNDFLLRLALAQELYDSSSERFKTRRGQRAVRGLMRDFPKQGVVYVLAASLPQYADVDILVRKEGGGIVQEQHVDPIPPTRKQLDRLEGRIRLLDQAIAADPGNGWFHYQKTIYLYSLHRDAEAMRVVHLSAIAPRFTDYTDILARAMDRLCDLRGGFDPERRETKITVIPFPIFAETRETARITGHLAYAKIGQGNTDKGIAIALDQATAGYNMMRHSPTLIHALVGRALLAIGAAALDQTEVKPSTPEADRAARLAHYTRFLIDHGHSREAAILRNQWNMSERVVKSFRGYIDTEMTADNNALLYYPAVFDAATSVLAIALMCAIGWGVGALLTARRRTDRLWDRRAGVTSFLLAALVLAPGIVTLIMRAGFWPNVFDPDLSEAGLLRVYLLLIPLGVGLAALLSGAALMLLRAPAEGKNRQMPVWSLLIAYLSAAGGLVYLACRFIDISLRSYFFVWVVGNSPVIMILYPITALLVYGLIRVAQSRFGRVRGSAVLTFASTIRYGSALAVGIFAVAYICLLMMTAHYGARADVAARQSMSSEAAFIRGAFRSP